MPRHILPALILITLLHTGCSNSQTSDLHTQQPTAASLTEHPAIGALGFPLGTYTKIRATIISGEEIDDKEHLGMYLLRVTEVSGHPLAQPYILPFTLYSGSPAKLANDEFTLYQLKTGKTTGDIDGKEKAALEKDYVGKHVHLAVYETGGYSGNPSGFPKDFPYGQDHGFCFSTYLVVLTEEP